MLTHIHPFLRWFACKTRPVFNGIVIPGSVSRTIQGPPRIQSPFARLRRYPSFLAPTNSCARPIPSRLIRFPLFDGSLQVVGSPCCALDLPGVISKLFRQVSGPYPGGFHGLFPFLPMESSAFSNLSLDRLSHYAPVKRLLTGPRFRGLIIPLCSDPHVCSSPWSLLPSFPWQL